MVFAKSLKSISDSLLGPSVPGPVDVVLAPPAHSSLYQVRLIVGRRS